MANAIETETIVIAGGVLAVSLVAAYLLKKAGGTAGAALDSVASGGAVRAVGGAVANNVVAIGEQFGIPATSQTQCQIDMANGDTWAASFSCPLPTFVKYLANGARPPDTLPAPAVTDTYTPVNGWQAHGPR